MSHTEVISGKYKYKIHSELKRRLDNVNKLNTNDWDFKILISGNGMTRTGKSTCAVQIAQYIDSTFADNWEERMIFDGQKLIDTAYKIGKNKCLVYDEAREALDSKKQMQTFTKNLLDFFSQCGNLNHKIIIVLPDFFDLPKSVAIVSSAFLINCRITDDWKRGYFDYYNRTGKKYLYIMGKKFLDYNRRYKSFDGTFTKQFLIDKDLYESKKSKALIELRNRENKTKDRYENTHKKKILLAINKFKELGYNNTEIGKIFGVTRVFVYHMLKEEEIKIKVRKGKLGD